MNTTKIEYKKYTNTEILENTNYMKYKRQMKKLHLKQDMTFSPKS